MESILKQSYRPIEILIADESTDRTATVAGRYGKQIRYLRQANAGTAAVATVRCFDATEIGVM